MRWVAIVVFVAASVIAGAPRLVETLRLARELARQPDAEGRRVVIFGPWYAAVQRLRDATPANATIDFVMLRAEARDIAVLGAAELQPRDVRLFDGWDAWRARNRAILLHDDRAANAVPGPPPLPAQFVVVVDPAADPPFRIVEAPR